MFAARYPFALPTALIAGLALLAGARAARDVPLREMLGAPQARAAIVSPPKEAQPVAAGQEAVRGADGLFYVTAKVNGRPLRFLVDTGASFVVLTAADARAVGVMLEEDHYNGSVETVGGSTPMAWTTLDHVHLAGHDVREVRAVVVRGGLPVSLLGQNMLGELRSMTLQADRLSLR